MELTLPHILGMGVALLLVFGLGVFAATKISNSVDFSVSGRRSGAPLVAGTIMGTLIGGASTVGTSQLAFLYGLSAWWFTLGGGIACLLMGLFLVRPLRETHFETISQFLASAYGSRAGVSAALFVSLGMFINVVPQVFSSMALLLSMFPLDSRLAALFSVALMTSYVIFGGVWGTGLMGVSKVALTGIILMVGGLFSLFQFGGFGGLFQTFPSYPWFSLFGRGVNTDLAAAFSMLVGVLSSQIYFQAIFSSRNLRAARGGALISFLLGPAIGAGGILIGLFMRLHHPEINPALALPLFIIDYMPPLFAGVALATLLLAAVGTGAGLTLGISTMLSRDIFQHLYPEAEDRTVLLTFRLFILAVLLLALITVYLSGKEVIILQWSYLSLGLRGATICFPLLAAIFLPGRVSPKLGQRAIVLGPSIVLAGTFIAPLQLNPLYLGLAASLLILAAALWDKQNSISS